MQEGLASSSHPSDETAWQVWSGSCGSMGALAVWGGRHLHCTCPSLPPLSPLQLWAWRHTQCAQGHPRLLDASFYGRMRKISKQVQGWLPGSLLLSPSVDVGEFRGREGLLSPSIGSGAGGVPAHMEIVGSSLWLNGFCLGLLGNSLHVGKVHLSHQDS